MEQAQVIFTGTVIAGLGPSQRTFHVHKAALERSPIIKAWIEDSSSIPESLRKDDALYFPYVDPEVVQTVIKFLERNGRKISAFEIDEESIVEEKRRDPIFFVRLYKLAGSLAIEDLCIAALQKFQVRKYCTERFIESVVEAEGGKLIEGKRFRDLMVGYMKQNSEHLSESEIFKKAVEGGGATAWAICSLMIKGISDSAIEASVESRKTEKIVLSGGGLPTPPASSEKNGSIQYLESLWNVIFKGVQQIPVSKAKSRGSKKRDLNATVEDATPSDEEDSIEVSKWDGIGKSSAKRARR